MFNLVIGALLVLAAVVVLVRVIAAVATLNIHDFGDHPWRFVGLAGYWSLAGAGAVAVVAGATIGGPILLSALAIFILTDRRAR